MENRQFLKMLEVFHRTCEEVNNENRINNPDSNVIYEVLQFSELAKKWTTLYDVADFYNYNWRGNIDFMHIPNFETILQNCKKYPIIIAREKDSDEVLCVSTIKYDENEAEHVDPYFPEEDAKYFSITGILAKKDSTHRGMGKNIYAIAIRGAYKYEKYFPGTKIMCVIDCRNTHSLKALSSAVDKANQDLFSGGENKLPAYVQGYYELRDKETNNLLEAPTLVLAIELQGQKTITEADSEVETGEVSLDFHREDGEELFESLSRTTNRKLSEYGISHPIVNEDPDCGKVIFYPLERKCGLDRVQINPNGTEKGNDREPMNDKTKNTIFGPHIAWLGDER